MFLVLNEMCKKLVIGLRDERLVIFDKIFTTPIWMKFCKEFHFLTKETIIFLFLALWNILKRDLCEIKRFLFSGKNKGINWRANHKQSGINWQTNHKTNLKRENKNQILLKSARLGKLWHRRVKLQHRLVKYQLVILS